MNMIFGQIYSKLCKDRTLWLNWFTYLYMITYITVGYLVCFCYWSHVPFWIAHPLFVSNTNWLNDCMKIPKLLPLPTCFLLHRKNFGIWKKNIYEVAVAASYTHSLSKKNSYPGVPNRHAARWLIYGNFSFQHAFIWSDRFITS